MRSTKFYSATLALALVFTLAGTLAAQNENIKVQLGKDGGGIGMYDACTPIADFAPQGCTSVVNIYLPVQCYTGMVDVRGSTEVDFHKSGKHATVHVLFHNTGQQYQLNLEANQQFDQVLSTYFVPFHSVFTPLNGGSTFKMDGTVEIDTDANGIPQYSNVMYWDPAKHPLTLSCSNPKAN